MKKNLSKVIVPTLAIALGAALAGSISGTVAWYQYSTRVNVAYIGTSVGLSQNLQVKIKGYGNWQTNLTHQDISSYLATQVIHDQVKMGDAVQPITFAGMNETDKLPAKAYQNPVAVDTPTAPYSGWLEADGSMYVQIPLQLRFSAYDNVKVNEEDQAFLEKDVYLSDLLIQEDYMNAKPHNNDANDVRKDLSSAVRVHISSFRDDDESAEKVESTKNRLISKDGGTTFTSGHLDIDGTPGVDVVKTGASGANYGFGENITETKIVYGAGTQTAFSAKTGAAVEGVKYYDSEGVEAGTEKVYPMVVASEENSAKLDEDDMEYAKDGVQGQFSKSLGHTIASEKGDEKEGKYLNVVITIWVEGWSLLPAPTQQDPDAKSAMWKAADYIGSMFDVGFQFAVQAE